MAQPKRWVHLEMTVPLEQAHDIEMLLVGKPLRDWKRVVVLHGGENENGELQALPPVRDIILAIASSQQTFRPRDLKEVLTEQGRSTTNVYTQLAALIQEGVMKRVDEGVYALATHKKPAAKKSKRGQHLRKTKKAAKPNPLKGRIKAPQAGTQPAAILDAVRKKQNGDGAGVPLDLIRETIGVKPSDNISPAITSLVARKFLKRVSPGRYRAGA